MSIKYDEYLESHKEGVRCAFNWIRDNIPEVLRSDEEYEETICWAHDASKTQWDEYYAYDRYFYGKNKSYAVVQDFKVAWLKHIHRNPHHWQYWVLINDDDGTVALEMPHVYIVEMICDWWSFSFRAGNLYEIFSWYKNHEKTMILAEETRKTVEDILNKIKTKLYTMKENKEEN